MLHLVFYGARAEHVVTDRITEVLVGRVSFESRSTAIVTDLHARSTDILEETAIDDTVVRATAHVEANGTEVREGTSVERDEGATTR
jgi:hypothetical protein